VNALDAAFVAYAGISALRQQIRPEQRVHGVISGRDWTPNGSFPFTFLIIVIIVIIIIGSSYLTSPHLISSQTSKQRGRGQKYCTT
jgi:hypothetical protein